MSEGRMLSVTMTAKRLDVCPETVRRWIKQGKLSAIRYPSGYFRVSIVAIEKILSTTSNNRHTA